MDDYISRQAAIEALGDEPESWNDTDAEIAERNQWRLDSLAIEAVPSADVVPVVRCKDCWYSRQPDRHSLAEGRVREGVQDLILFIRHLIN